jgi:hypothetical protein
LEVQLGGFLASRLDMTRKLGSIVAIAAVAVLLAGCGQRSPTNAMDNSAETAPVDVVDNSVATPISTSPPSSVQPATPPSVHFNLIAFSRPGWYAATGDVIATSLFAGPYTDQASCDADVAREHSLGDTTHYDCQLLRNGGMTTVPLGPESGAQPASASSVRFGATDFSRPGWYVEMDEMPGAALFGGPYADQASCNIAVVRDRSSGDTGHYNCQFVSAAP